MAQVTVTINGRKYQVACDDGQEAHLTGLAQYVDKRAGELVASVGQVGDARLMVMVSLLIADELSDAYDKLEELGAGEPAKSAPASLQASIDQAVGAEIELLAERLEGIAERLKGS
jgi:cell division protein ZapA